MKPNRVHFSILAVIALVMVMGSGYVLRFQTPDTKGVLLGWGFVFTAGCVFFVRAMLIINKINRQG